MKKIAVLALFIMSILASSIQVNASSTGIIGPSVIHKEQNRILTIADIIDLYASDLGVIQVADDQYTGFGNILGSHWIQLFSTDGETHSTKDVEIIVIPALGNVLAVTDYKNIFVRTNQVLTPSQIVQILENTGHLEITSTTQMMMLTNTYTEGASVPGIYYFEFRLVNAAGVNTIFSSVITVSEEDDPFIPDIVFEAPPSFISRAWRSVEPFVYLGAILIGVIMFIKHKNKRKKAFYQ